MLRFACTCPWLSYFAPLALNPRRPGNDRDEVQFDVVFQPRLQAGEHKREAFVSKRVYDVPTRYREVVLTLSKFKAN